MNRTWQLHTKKYYNIKNIRFQGQLQGQNLSNDIWTVFLALKILMATLKGTDWETGKRQ